MLHPTSTVLTWSNGGAGRQGGDLFFCKTFRSDVLMTVIFYDTTFYCTLTDASEEQALVDTLFPNIYGRQNGMQVGRDQGGPVGVSGEGQTTRGAVPRAGCLLHGRCASTRTPALPWTACVHLVCTTRHHVAVRSWEWALVPRLRSMLPAWDVCPCCPLSPCLPTC